MDTIAKLLSQYKLRTNGREARERAVEYIKELVDMTLDIKQISFKNGTLFVSAPGIIKSEIHLHKDALLKKIQENCVHDKVIDIR